MIKTSTPPLQTLIKILLSSCIMLASFASIGQNTNSLKCVDAPTIIDDCVTRCGAGFASLTVEGGYTNQNYYWYAETSPGNLTFVAQTTSPSTTSASTLSVAVPANTTQRFYVNYVAQGDNCFSYGAWATVISDPIRVTVTPSLTTVCAGSLISYFINITNVDCGTTHNISIADQIASGFTRNSTSPSFPTGSVSLAPNQSLNYTVTGTYSVAGSFIYRPLITDITLGNCLESPQVTTIVTSEEFEIEQGYDLCAGSTINVRPIQASLNNIFEFLDVNNNVVPGSTCTFTGATPNCNIQVPTIPGIYFIRYTAVSNSCTTVLIKTVYVFGKNRSFYFDGNNDRITIDDNPDYSILLSDFTLEGWVKVERGIEGESTLISKGNSQDDGLIFLIGTGGETLEITIDGQFNQSNRFPNSIYDGECHHVAVTRSSGGEIMFYLDGNLVGSGSNSGYFSNSAPLIIGNDNLGISRPLEGWMDEVRFWQVDRSRDEISASMSIRIPDNFAQALGYWPLNEDNSQTLLDYSIVANNAKLGITTSIEGEDPKSSLDNCNDYCVESEYRTASSLKLSNQPVNDLLNKSDFEVSLAPNPFSAVTNLQVNSQKFESYKIVLLSISGKEIFTKQISTNTTVSIGESLKPGLYILHIITGAGNKTMKLIKR